MHDLMRDAIKNMINLFIYIFDLPQDLKIHKKKRKIISSSSKKRFHLSLTFLS